MHGRLGAALVVGVAAIAALIFTSATAPQARGAEMCPPVTLEILFPAPVESHPGSALAPGAPESTTTIPDPATTTSPAPPPCEPFRYDMRWPLAGTGHLGSPFGSDRDGGQRHHQGNDIAAPKLTPVVAVADAVVMQVHQEVGTEDCCYLALRHDDGWQSYYIHLNNDRWGTDDGLGIGVRTDLAPGTEVAAGEVIGWVGDSGNAEDSVDHLHFELRTPEGVAVDPRPSLEEARHEASFLAPQPTWPYVDDEGQDIEWLAATLVSEGLFLPCDEAMTMLCPEEVASPEFVSDLVRELTGQVPPPLIGRYPSLPSSLETGRQLSRTVEEALGCSPIEDCMDLGLPETELARVAAWARMEAIIAASVPMSPTFEGGPVVRLPTAEDAETRFRAEGIREACNPPLDDTLLLTRGVAITRLVAWIRGQNPEPCSEVQPTR